MGNLTSCTVTSMHGASLPLRTSRELSIPIVPGRPKSALLRSPSAAVTGASRQGGECELMHIPPVFFGGVVYVSWYKKNVLDKMELAFARGYDPALELAGNTHKQHAAGDDYVPWTQHVRRREQSLIDRIVRGHEVGQYYLLLGPKGTGKGTMILDAMGAIEAEGVAVCDAHPDLEVFRLRLGKALNYEFNEDTQTGLFQRRDPREAFNKLEKVALRYARRTGRPLVLILNNIHFFNNDDDGKHMLLQMQQRAESWAAAGIVSMVFSSDDFWPFLTMRKSASRMQVVTVSDLTFKDALRASAQMRLNAKIPTEPDDLHDAVSIVGGRLSYLAKISKQADMRAHAQHMLVTEKARRQSTGRHSTDTDHKQMEEKKKKKKKSHIMRDYVNQPRDDEPTPAKATPTRDQSPQKHDQHPRPKRTNPTLHANDLNTRVQSPITTIGLTRQRPKTNYPKPPNSNQPTPTPTATKPQHNQPHD
ncbi:hypothetical protein FOMPIDRAFT_1015321 [Fomitopsis schrenkii]|uniref:Orc1-like AAA ATPase domain-containing protein n=1 Tax=Fomitopsis schrenkii TaxID=2126942 RepID=S8FWD4_FOMSC|nr:hypothetical protein FOMPIDRAFT_1015321 [Fomitopsis schrenkii]